MLVAIECVTSWSRGVTIPIWGAPVGQHGSGSPYMYTQSSPSAYLGRDLG